MSGIAKSDLPSSAAESIAAFSFPADHPAVAVWTEPGTGLLHRLNASMQTASAHPARTVILLPYAQLRPLAARLWAQTFADGFTPRFETSMSWVASLPAQALDAVDIHFDAAMDSLTAHELLAAAGLAAQADTLAGRLMQCAQEAGALACTLAPEERAAWAQAARQTLGAGMSGQALQWEAAVARIALEWAAMSAYQSDLLFSPATVASVDLLVLVQGLQPDPLAQGLRGVWGDKLVVLPLAQAGRSLATQGADIALHECLDAEDEAQRAAACVLRHIEAGRFPLALVSSDRALTRRVRAMLEGANVPMRDENGWKLSTSAAAAQLMALLKAAAWNASGDAVLAWLKQAPAFASCASALESVMRRHQLGEWRNVPGHSSVQEAPALLALCAQVETVRSTLAGRHGLLQWVQRLREALQAGAQWDALQSDGPGAQVLDVLRLETAPYLALGALAETAAWGRRRLDAAEFTAWVNQTLEAAHFQPVYPAQEEVVILPMSQMLGRPFAALVMAGCDEVRLSPSPEPPGMWTAAQRAALGLPPRDALDAALRAAWILALQTPVCDVLWRTGDEAGETLLPSALVQLLQLDPACVVSGADPRVTRMLNPRPVLPPLPSGAALPVTVLSQSAYDDLRQCPYRFFALRQLGLAQVDELDAELGKRDFGIWLHEVLKLFHEGLANSGEPDAAQWPALIDAASVQATRDMALPEAEFLPYAASWPAVRDGYLDWLTGHVAHGTRFADAETSHRQCVGPVVLQGRIDRMDRTADGSTLVLDYKTESATRTSARIKDALEDTQMAFYAALLQDDSLRAAYVNVGEKETRLLEQKQVVYARDALIEGIVSDMRRIADGATLPALGDGDACTYCKARGLCRKDFWGPA